MQLQINEHIQKISRNITINFSIHFPPTTRQTLTRQPITCLLLVVQYRNNITAALKNSKIRNTVQNTK